MVNVTTATVAALITHTMATQYHLSSEVIYVLDVLAVSFVLMIVSEIIPKTVAVKKPVKFAYLAVKPILFFYYLFFPISYIVHLMSEQLQQGIMPVSKNGLSEEEIKTLVEVGAEKGTLEEDEKEMITSIFDFTETSVKEIMVPRTDMKAIEVKTPFEQVIETIRKSGYSRIPVYEDKIDNIIGILYVKDLLPFLDRKQKTMFHLEKILHTPYFVPENKKIHELLKDFQEEKIHMAIIVDEYGGIEGLVTLEDIIEEIVGEIQDEYDKEEILVKKIDSTSYIFDGRTSLEEFMETMNQDLGELENEDIETLSGLILHIIEKIPRKGDVITYKNLKFIIQEVEKNRIQKVKVEKLPIMKK
jgi:gliding motility-associated protein GldE